MHQLSGIHSTPKISTVWSKIQEQLHSLCTKITRKGLQGMYPAWPENLVGLLWQIYDVHSLTMLYQIQKGLKLLILSSYCEPTTNGPEVDTVSTNQQHPNKSTSIRSIREPYRSEKDCPAVYNYRQSNSRRVHSCHPSHWCSYLRCSISSHYFCIKFT